jgi:septal ring factor EnvC (AmiA/AmiB activator)
MMGWITDILKGLPLSAILKENLEKLEAEHGRLESELQRTKADLALANETNKMLTDRVNKAQEDEHLEEIEEKILLVLSGLHGQKHVNGDVIANHLQIDMTRAEFYLSKLQKDQFISAAYSYMNPTSYKLADRGNEYVVKNNLV